MIKEKPKEESSLEYWWNEFLFSRKLSFNTTYTLEQAANQLKDIHTARFSEGLVNPRTIVTPLETYENKMTYEIELERLRRKRKNQYYQTAFAFVLLQTNLHGLVQVEINAKVDKRRQFILLGGIAFIVFLLATTRFGMAWDELLYLLGGLFVAVLAWFSMLEDRNLIIKMIQIALIQEKAKNDA